VIAALLLVLGLQARADEDDADAAAAELEPPVCSTDQLQALPTPPERLAVVWVAPWWRRPHGHVTVIPTSELRAWLAEQSPRWTGRTLQWMGLRRRNTDPRRRYQVRILEVERDELCRPIEGVEAGVLVEGIPACRPRHLQARRKTDRCGHARDRRTDGTGPTQYVVKLRDVKERGWCVVPLRRYVDEVGAPPGE